MITSVGCFFTVKYKYLLGIDDGLDIFAIHGMGGVIGDILTGLLAAQFVPALDGVSGTAYEGGWWNQHWRQLGLQIAGAVTCAAWSFVISCILLFVINKIPGMHIRASEESEVRGLDYKYFSDLDWEAGFERNATIPTSEGVRRGSTPQVSQETEVEPKRD